MLLSQYFNNTTLQRTSLSKIRIFATSLAAPSLLHPPGEASESTELVLLLLVHSLQLRCCGAEALCTDEVFARTGSPEVAESSEAAVVLPNGEEAPRRLPSGQDPAHLMQRLLPEIVGLQLEQHA
jgi:hypothetical protein